MTAGRLRNIQDRWKSPDRKGTGQRWRLRLHVLA